MSAVQPLPDHVAAKAVNTGNGQSSSRLDGVNQRSAMRGCAKGVQSETITAKAIRPISRPLAWRLARSATGPSVLNTSQVAPSSA